MILLDGTTHLLVLLLEFIQLMAAWCHLRGWASQ